MRRGGPLVKSNMVYKSRLSPISGEFVLPTGGASSGRTLRSAGPRHPTVPHREMYGLGWKKESGACPYWRRGGPLGRPAGKTSVFWPFPANSYCLPAVRPGGRALRVGGHSPPTPTEIKTFKSSKVVEADTWICPHRKERALAVRTCPWGAASLMYRVVGPNLAIFGNGNFASFRVVNNTKNPGKHTSKDLTLAKIILYNSFAFRNIVQKLRILFHAVRLCIVG